MTGLTDNQLQREQKELTILTLLQQLSQTNTTRQQLLCGSVQVGAELSKGSDLTVLGQLQLHGAGHLLHGLGLGSRADAGHGEADVDGRTNALRI